MIGIVVQQLVACGETDRRSGARVCSLLIATRKATRLHVVTLACDTELPTARYQVIKTNNNNNTLETRASPSSSNVAMKLHF